MTFPTQIFSFEFGSSGALAAIIRISKRSLAAERVNADRDVHPVLFIFIIKLFEPLIHVAKIAHEIGHGPRSGDIQLFRMAAFDRRTRNVRQVFAQDDVRTAAEHLAQFHDIGEFGKPRHHFEPARGINLQRGFRLSEGRCKTVKGVNIEIIQRFR